MALAYRRDNKTTEPRIPATDARVHFGELLQHVTGTAETVVIERNGREVAALLPIETLRRQQVKAQNAEWREALRVCQQAFHPQVRRGFPVEVAEIIRRGRQERTERIMHALLGR